RGGRRAAERRAGRPGPGELRPRPGALRRGLPRRARPGRDGYRRPAGRGRRGPRGGTPPRPLHPADAGRGPPRGAAAAGAAARGVPMVGAGGGGEGGVLAEGPDGAPLLVAAGLGQGKVVQWLLSPKVWTHPYLGHARGLDDLLWKGIAWAARKPFVMKAMPPFVRARFDDCYGWWRDAADLAWVDVWNAHGHVPSLS